MPRVKRHVGRPKKSDMSKRDNYVTVRLTDREYYIVREGCRLSGLTMSQYIRIYGVTEYEAVENSRKY